MARNMCKFRTKSRFQAPKRVQEVWNQDVSSMEILYFQVSQKVVPQFGIAKLVQITPISLWFMADMTIVNGVYKPTNITFGGLTLHILSLTGDCHTNYSNYTLRCHQLRGLLENPAFSSLIFPVAPPFTGKGGCIPMNIPVYPNYIPKKTPFSIYD